MQNYSSVVKTIKPSIAFINVLNNGNFTSGSGFVFYKSGILVTCNHVVLNDDNKIFISFPDMSPSDNMISAKVISRNIKSDIALLEYKDVIQRNPLIESKEIVEEGMPVIFSGYPLSMRTLTTHQGIISSINEDVTGAKTYLIDGTVNPGNSGCPLMTISGELIGIVNATQREDKDLLNNIANMDKGIMSIQGIDIAELYQALIKNLQLGIGYAMPCSYIPKH